MVKYKVISQVPREEEQVIDRPHTGGPALPYIVGGAGYKVETLTGEKTSWSLVVRLRH